MQQYQCWKKKNKKKNLFNLDSEPPDGLQGHGDTRDNSVGYGEVKHQVVDIGNSPLLWTIGQS